MPETETCSRSAASACVRPQVLQLQGAAILVGEPTEQRAKAQGQLTEHQLLVLDPGIGSDLRRRLRLRVEHLAPTARHLVVVLDDIAGDPEHPCRQALVVLDAVEVAMHPHDDLTHQVLGLLAVRDPPSHERPQTGPELGPDIVEARRGSAVAGDRVLGPIPHAR